MLEKLSWREEKLLPRRIQFEPFNSSSSAPVSSSFEGLHWKIRQGVQKGLKNVGNTCFLNSTLQCLIHTPPIQNYPHSCSKSFCVFCGLKRLFNSKSSVPEEFLLSVPRLSRQFQIGRQADAHELLRFLIDKLDLKEIKNKIFGGTLQSTVKCKECRYESITNEPFLDLSLEVSANDIEKCIADFCREEVLSGNNKYNCPNCKRKTVATKQYLIKNAPNILTIQLKRFTNQGNKDSRTVRFGEALNLEDFLIFKEKCVYKLYAVLIHIGFGCRSGHYYSFIKAPNECWFEANDSMVSQASLSRVLNNNGAYILMYKKDTPKPKLEENSVADNRNNSEKSELKHESPSKIFENYQKKCEDIEKNKQFPGKHYEHPTEEKFPMKKVKIEEQEFKKYWSRDSLSIGYVKDEYDRKLDMGKKKKKKNKKRFLSSNVWDRVKLTSY